MPDGGLLQLSNWIEKQRSFTRHFKYILSSRDLHILRVPTVWPVIFIYYYSRNRTVIFVIFTAIYMA